MTQLYPINNCWVTTQPTDYCLQFIRNSRSRVLNLLFKKPEWFARAFFVREWLVVGQCVGRGLCAAALLSTSQSWNPREFAAEDWGTVNAEPLVEYGRVELAEVGVEFYVAVLKIVQAGVLAD